MQTLRKKTSPCKYRNDPGRFFGDGVTFKAKLIGILEVGEARGDRMCQEALQDLKMAIRAAGEHKQRITIHVTIDGLRLRDEKTSDSLYHHPVHKISFIAQDMSDSRAFGYIFGSPDSGHRFFGIKTDKAASQVVLAMRDLFQVVFELKKKEIELARQHIQSKTIHEHQTSVAALTSAMSMKNNSSIAISSSSTTSPQYNIKSIHEPSTSKVINTNKEMSPESVADLVDLEQELSSIQRGITQMERITPNEAPPNSAGGNGSGGGSVGGGGNAGIIAPTNKSISDDDPFGDSFTHFPTYNLLPPPESSKSRHSKPLKPPEEQTRNSPTTAILSNSSSTITKTSLVTTISSVAVAPSAAAPTVASSTTPVPTDDWLSTPTSSIPVTNNTIIPAFVEEITAKLNNHNQSPNTLEETKSTNDLNKEDSMAAALSELNGSNINAAAFSATNTTTTTTSTATAAQQAMSLNQYIDAFTDLDPLGTGKSKPYIDKKYFFQDLKNPPKKVLKDLSEQESVFTANFSGNNTEILNGSDFNKLNDRKLDQPISDDLKMFESSILPTNTDGSSKIDNQKNDLRGMEFIKNNYQKTETLSSIFKTDDPIIGNNKALLVSDNDPFSPRMKKFDPFDDDFGKSMMHDPFEFGFNGGKTKSTTILPDTKIGSTGGSSSGGGSGRSDEDDKKFNDFNGPLQVNLPPETYSTYHSSTSTIGGNQKRLERHNSDAGDSSTSSATAAARMRPNVFKQNTVDAINSISSKKMKPHLFSQKYSKRDSNSINMRRLQESDSLSESETAPEPPPRPDSSSQQSSQQQSSDPPPLPPKKQFSDAIIRPRVTSPLAQTRDSSHQYEYIGKIKNNQLDSPALPLPSRKIGRSDGSFPGPIRPAKKLGTSSMEDDYLTPIGGGGDVPVLLPPPQSKGSTKNRGRRQPEPTPSIGVGGGGGSGGENTKIQPQQSSPKLYNRKDQNKMTVNTTTNICLPDITLSQLLTLGIDDLAMKLNVPSHKLSTMNIVELTKYLSDYIEKSSQASVSIEQNYHQQQQHHHQQQKHLHHHHHHHHQQQQQQQQQHHHHHQRHHQHAIDSSEPAIFKVNFDHQSSDATFIAKFDDNFGEDEQQNFVPNFANFENSNNQKNNNINNNKTSTTTSTLIDNSVDRYAVFREIIEQDMKTSVDEDETNETKDQHQQQQEDGEQSADFNSSFGSGEEPSSDVDMSNEDTPAAVSSSQHPTPPLSTQQQQIVPPTVKKIDTKITQVISQAKDRYAALRDIILIEDLFDKSVLPPPPQSSSTTQSSSTITPATNNVIESLIDTSSRSGSPHQLTNVSSITKNKLTEETTSIDDFPELVGDQIADVGTNHGDSGVSGDSVEPNDEKQSGSSPEINISIDLDNSHFEQKLTHIDSVTINNSSGNKSISPSQITIATTGTTTKDDLEIDEYMNRAISNLSLDSRDHLSPISAGGGGGAGGKSPTQQLQKNNQQNASTSPIQQSNLLLTTSNENITTNGQSSLSSASQQQQQQLPKQQKLTLNNMSTSPIAMLQPIRSPSTSINQQVSSPNSKSPINVNMSRRSPIPQAVSELIRDSGGGSVAGEQSERKKHLNSIGSLSDVICGGSSPEVDKNNDQPSESWAVFEPSADELIKDPMNKSPRQVTTKVIPNPESPCSSDEKNEQEFNKRWPRGHTSSSSRDLSPWDDDCPVPPGDYRRRGGPPLPQQQLQPDRHGFYMRHARRMHSGGDEDYDYDDDIAHSRRSTSDHHRRQRSRGGGGGGGSGGGENFADNDPSWYHQHQQSWSPPEEEDEEELERKAAAAARHQFERSSYERATYGPPYEKRGGGGGGGGGGDDYKDYKSFDKRKFYRGGDYVRSGYEYETYYDDYDPRLSSLMVSGKSRRDYDESFDSGGIGSGIAYSRHSKNSKDYFYDREKRSFDRESTESYDSAMMGGGGGGGGGGGAGRRRRSYGSGGDMYGSLDSREEYRERYSTVGSGGGGIEKQRSLRKGQPKHQRSTEEYDQDSDGEITASRRGGGGSSSGAGGPGDTRSLNRPSQQGPNRPRKSSGSSPWDGDDLTPTSSQKSWKRPASASESDRRLSENRRGITHTLPGGSDSEKDRRFRKKMRQRGKEISDCATGRPNYATLRHPSTSARSVEVGIGSPIGGGGGSYLPPSEYDLDDGNDFIPGNRTSSAGGSGRRSKKDMLSATTRTMIQDRRRKDYFEFDRNNMEGMHKFSKSNRDIYNYRSTDNFDEFIDEDSPHHHHHHAHHHHQPQQPSLPPPPPQQQQQQQQQQSSRSQHSAMCVTKCNIYDDDNGVFENEYNSPSNGGGSGGAGGSGGLTVGTGGKSLRFSNDFSAEKELQRQHQQLHHHHPIIPMLISGNGNCGANNNGGSGNVISGNDAGGVGIIDITTTNESNLSQTSADTTIGIQAPHITPTPISQKLRFDDKVMVSNMFDDDDFSKAEFSFENEDQWNAQLPKRNNLKSSVVHSSNVGGGGGSGCGNRRPENIRKSESVNIFAKKREDPFEDDDFFNTASVIGSGGGASGGKKNVGDIEDNGRSGSGDNYKWDKNFAEFEGNI